MTAHRPIALIGLRCSGKSRVGRELASALGAELVDLDEMLVQVHAADEHAQDGRLEPTAGELLAQLGEPAFRALETRALERVLGHAGRFVLATGGGIVESAANRELLASCARCVWLRVPVDELARRMRADDTPRPGLLGPDPVAEIVALEERRAPLYTELAELTVDGRPAPETVCAEVLDGLALRPQDPAHGAQ